MLASITPFSLLDFPNRLSAILWFSHCNLRCKYCYNSEIVFNKEYLDEQKVLAFLDERINFLQGVVCSGGECCMWGNRLIKLVKSIKKRGFQVKIDTNGSYPKVLKSLIPLIDYVAIDFKAPKHLMKKVCGVDYFYKFEQSLDLLLDSGIDFEVRTTYHSSLLSKEDILEMYKFLTEKGYNNKYFIQMFNDTKGSLANLQASELVQFEEENIKIRS